tara:strand:- start:3667 stop:3966 length:300 start_codon:yes stop_codon:yes gene_type:complete
MIKVEIKKSDNPKKKFVAIFYGGEKHDKKIKTTHFGAKGFSDYTIHNDDKRKQRYLDRHRKRENWNAYMTAGSLSRWILWNKKTLKSSINDYKKRFNLI